MVTETTTQKNPEPDIIPNVALASLGPTARFTIQQGGLLSKFSMCFYLMVFRANKCGRQSSASQRSPKKTGYAVFVWCNDSSIDGSVDVWYCGVN